MAISPKCHVICVMGGKGGVGKSVFAANLACAFLREMRAPTLLIDLDIKSCGDQNIITGLRPIKTVEEIATFQGAINPQSLKQLITPHPSGLSFIGAVTSPEFRPEIPGELFRKQLQHISQFYNYIIIDMGSQIEELHLGFIEDASSILMITTPEVLTVNQTRKTLSELMAATVPGDLFQIVVNKMVRNGLAPQAIQQSLRRPVIGSIPQDDAITYQALQTSTPFVLTQANSHVTGSYHHIVRQLTSGILQKLKSMSRPKPRIQEPAGENDLLTGKMGATNVIKKGMDPLTQLKMTIHNELIKEMDLKKDLMNTKGDPSKEKELRNKTMQAISVLTDRLGQGLSREERSRVIKEVLDESLGLGPLETLLADSKVSEIMVNGYDHI
ncbi:MAG: P-loop NTPase, partial [Bdellovibrionales bacterium]|nr:P-loop NTPase [Bdellovibrionales bacterium]